MCRTVFPNFVDKNIKDNDLANVKGDDTSQPNSVFLMKLTSFFFKKYKMLLAK